MVIVHVPHWEIETAYQIDDDGEILCPNYFFTRAYATTSFAYSLREHLLQEEDWDIDVEDLIPLVKNEYWYTRYGKTEDGRMYWEYVPTGPDMPKAFPVTYVMRRDLEPFITEDDE